MLSKEYILLVSGDKPMSSLESLNQTLGKFLFTEKINPKTLVHADRPKTLDRQIATWGLINNLEIKKFKPNWDSWGISAESKRDWDMCIYSDIGIIFSQSYKNNNIIEIMKRLNKKIYIIGE